MKMIPSRIELAQRRWMPLHLAADYVGAKSPQAFYKQWRKGKWPDPVKRDTRPMIWDREALDRHLVYEPDYSARQRALLLEI